MLTPMFRWLMRSSVFTAMVVLLFTAGCEYPEPNTAAAYAGEEPEEATAAVPVEEQQQQRADPADAAALTQADYEDTDPSAITEFRAELAPYGQWVDDPVYGLVWIPSAELVGADFAPYVTGGHWGMTADGDWIWESDYPFGWATFHYGRWLWIPGRGWAWIAGRRYANAWVTWRVGYDSYDYVGWAPMPPYYYWSGGYAVAFWVMPPAPYVFCPSAYVFAPHLHGHIVHGSRVGGIAAHSHPVGDHAAASPGRGGSHAFATPRRGPTLKDARIPDSARPNGLSTPPAKALSFAHPPNAAAASRHAMVRPGGAMAGSSPSVRGAAPMSRPVYRGTPALSSRGPVYDGARSTPSMAGRPTQAPGRLSTSNPSWRGGSPSYSAPAARTPSYSSPSMRSTSPSYGSSYRSSSPSYGSSFRGSSPSYRAPSGGFSPSPSFRPPSSTPSYRPSSRPSGGGRRGR